MLAAKEIESIRERTQGGTCDDCLASGHLGHDKTGEKIACEKCLGCGFKDPESYCLVAFTDIHALLARVAELEGKLKEEYERGHSAGITQALSKLGY